MAFTTTPNESLRFKVRIRQTATMATVTFMLAVASCKQCDARLIPDDEEHEASVSTATSMPCMDPRWAPPASATRFATIPTWFNTQPRLNLSNWTERKKVRDWQSLEGKAVDSDRVQQTLTQDVCVETQVGLPSRVGLVCRAESAWLSAPDDCAASDWRVWALEGATLRLVWEAFRNRVPASITVDILDGGATLRVREVGNRCCQAIANQSRFAPPKKKPASNSHPPHPKRTDGCRIVGLHPWKVDRFDDGELPLDVRNLEVQCGPRIDAQDL